MKERFKGKDWKRPYIKDGELTKWNWMVTSSKNLKLGQFTDIGAFTYLQAEEGITIGDYCQIGSHCAIYSVNTIDNQRGEVVIEEGVCIGAGTIIMPSVTIGKNSKVGALSLVLSGTKIPSNEVWAGIPVKRIRAIDQKQQNKVDFKRTIVGRDISQEELKQKEKDIISKFK